MSTRTVKLTRLERQTAIAEARASGVEWADEVVLELAEADKRDALEQAEKSELGQLKKRVAQLERLLGPKGDRIYASVGKAIARVLPEFIAKQGLMRYAGFSTTSAITAKAKW